MRYVHLPAGRRDASRPRASVPRPLGWALALAILLPAAASASPSSSDIRIVQSPAPRPGVVELRALILSGSASDPEGREGLASFTASMMLRGTGPRRRGQIEETLQKERSTLTVATGKDAILLSGSTSPTGLDTFYAVFKEVLLNPSFDEAEIGSLLSEREAEIDALRRDGAFLAGSQLDALLYRNHGYGHIEPGRSGAIARFSREDLIGFHRAHLRRGNLVIGVAGSVQDSFIRRLRDDLSVLPEGAPPPAEGTTTYLPRRRVVVVEMPRADRTWIAMGHPLAVSRDHSDYFPLLSAVEVLGAAGAAPSRLSRELAASRGIADNASALIEERPVLNAPPRRLGTFVIRLEPRGANAKFAIKMAVSGMTELVTGGIPPHEVLRAKALLSDRHAAETKAAGGALETAMSGIVAGVSGFDARFRKSLDAVTADRASAAAARHLLPDRLGIVAVVKDAAAFIEEMLSRETRVEPGETAGREATSARDLEIVGLDLGLKREDFEVVKAADLFR